MGSVLHAVVRPLIELWMAGASSSWRRLPHPIDIPAAHSVGIDSDRILLVGGGLAFGYGVMSHDLALGGHLVRQITRYTGRGADIDIDVHERASVSATTARLSQMDLSRFDAILVVVGTLEALQLMSERDFRRDITRLLEVTAQASTHVFMLDIAPVASIARLPLVFTRAVNRRTLRFSEVIRELSTSNSDTCISLGLRLDSLKVMIGREMYLEWASRIAPFMIPALDSAAGAPTLERCPAIDEEARLRSLRELDVLNSRGEPEFDEVVETARNLFGTDAAALNFIDRDEQWVKSVSGRNLENVPREESLCEITIQRPELFVVEDLAADTRFRDRSWVKGDDGVRFYAGYPIEAPDGQRVGALCLLDSQTRTFTESDHALLRQLALRLQAIIGQRWREAQKAR